MSFEDAGLREWWAGAFPDTDVIDHGLRAGRAYDAYVILDHHPGGRIVALVGYNPRLTLREQELAALECKRRVDSFADRGRNGPYNWQPRTADVGFQSWVSHRSPIAEDIWPRGTAAV